MLIDMILSIIENEFCKQYLKAIKNTLNMCLSLVSDMLDLKMIKECQFVPNNIVFNPVETIKFIFQIFETQIGGRNIELQLETSDMMEIEMMEGDENRLKQVLVNLIKNAIKFTRKGYIRVVLGFDETLGQLLV